MLLKLENIAGGNIDMILEKRTYIDRYICVYIYRKRETERDRERQRETERDRERQIETER